MAISNLDKAKSQKLTKCIFDGPLIINQTFSQTEYIIGKSDLHILWIFIKPRARYWQQRVYQILLKVLT